MNEDKPITAHPKKENLPLTYYVVNLGEPSLRVRKFFCNYETALKEARAIGCIVTNGSWLRSQGVRLEITTASKNNDHVIAVSFNGIALMSS